MTRVINERVFSELFPSCSRAAHEPRAFLTALVSWRLATRGVNDILLTVYPIRIVFDKTVWVKFFFVSLLGMGMGKNFFSLAKRVWVRVKAISYPLGNG